MQLIDDIPVWGTPDPGAVEQIKRVRETAVAAALMADHHKGYSMPIGGVAAYPNHISPSGVGYDIACGNKAVLTDLTWDSVRDHIPAIMDRIFQEISFGMGRVNETDKVEHALFDDDPAWSIREIGGLKSMAHKQLGTVGSGNHYVDIFIDEQERVWIGVHFGSRGLGHKIATHYLNAAGAVDAMDAAPTLLEVNSDLGQQYLLGMHLAGRYAYAGRDWVCAKVVSILGAQALDEVHNHHNFAWHENHDELGHVWVVRKGATPAFQGQRGFVGGSMGDISVVLEGRGITGNGPEDLGMYILNHYGLSSTVHGAGRVMSRTAAAGKSRRRWAWVCGNRDENHVVPAGDANRGKDGALPKCPKCGARMRKRETEEKLKEGAITREMMNAWLEEQSRRQGYPIELRGAGTDESPHCYKRLPDVLAAHQSTVRVLHTLYPVGVAMAGPDVVDPFKD